MRESSATAPVGEALFLCHRIPYPPNKGDKIRSYRWLLALAARYSVTLVAFVDADNDWTYAERLRRVCRDVYLIPLNPMRCKLRGIRSILTGDPVTLGYYFDRRVSKCVQAWREKNRTGLIFVYSSAMAQYAVGASYRGYRRVIDFVDVDSDKWRQYALHRKGPVSWTFAREARLLLAHDADVSTEFDMSLFVSEAEARFFRSEKSTDGLIDWVSNGVDFEYFRPDSSRVSPYPAKRPAIVFTGAMDYWPNVDAVSSFAKQVWPRVIDQVSAAMFYIVGSNPSPGVRALGSASIRVTGRVDDVRPYLEHASAVVAPMRVARGIQNKVLEGMAMARPVIVTPSGLEGISADHGRDILVGADDDVFADMVLDAIRGRYERVGRAARARVVRDHNWSDLTGRFLRLIDG